MWNRPIITGSILINALIQSFHKFRISCHNRIIEKCRRHRIPREDKNCPDSMIEIQNLLRS